MLQLARGLHEAMRRTIELTQSRLTRTEAQLSTLNPQRVLERGYSIAETASGVIVRDADTLNAGDMLKIGFARGRVVAEVKGKA
jgi:exodeoxyribonuclease VII large subunit